MITIDITMVIQIVNILIMIVVLNAVLYRPIRTLLIKRGDKLSELGQDIENFINNTKLQQEEITRKTNAARSKAKATLEEAKGQALAASAETLAEIRKQATATKTEQLAEIKKQFDAALSELKGQINGFAGDMAQKIMGRAL